MDEQSTATIDETPKRSRLVVPWIILVIGLLAVVLLRVFDDYLGDAIELDPGVTNLATLALPCLAVVCASLWYLVRRFGVSKLGTAFAILCIAAPVGFFALYQPAFGGNADVVGFKARYWGAAKKVVQRQAEQKQSRLSQTTPFDFPQFLGKDRDGKVTGVELLPWKEGQPELLWKQAVGDAWSGFAIVNGFVITQEQRDELECVVCYEAQTGNTVWSHAASRRHEDFMSFGRVGPRATPTIHEGRVYAMGGTGILECLDGETGDPVWEFDVPAAVGIDQTQKTNSRGQVFQQETSTLTWGRSNSPLIVGSWVVVAAGGIFDPAGKPVDPNAATLIAIDKGTGKEVWRGGQRMVSYGSPSLATVAGREQILLVGEDHAVGHDAATGQELWSFEFEGNSDSNASCSQVTVVNDHLVLLSKGYNIGAKLLRLEDKDGELTVESVKTDPRVLKTKFSNPVVHDGHAYAITDRFLECIEIDGLNRKWRQRGFGTGQLLMVGDHLLVHAEDGKLVLVAADPASYQERGRVETVSGTCWNTIGFYKDLAFVRSDKEMACFRLPIGIDEGADAARQ